MLTQVQQSPGGRRINYTYNADGLRTKKVVREGLSTTTTEYMWGSNGLAGYKTGDIPVLVLYDNEGSPVGFTVGTQVYTYVKNLQGDVIRVLAGDGSTVVSYTYDPWGVPTVTGNAQLAAFNPCSYRGYDYDEETGYYYLQSRYYDPEIGRFLNADESEYINATDSPPSCNLFVYSSNSPVLHSDPNGHLALAVAGATIYITTQMILTILTVVAALSTILFIITHKNEIKYAISKVLYKLETLEQTISTAVVAALMKGKTSKTAKHHIIARTDWRAWTSRYYWTSTGKADMDIADPINLVQINQYFHFYVHTSVYHASINSIVLTGWYTNQKVGVIAAVLAVHAFFIKVNGMYF